MFPPYLILAASSAFFALISALDNSCSNEPYDYILLSLQWAPGLCLSNKKCGHHQEKWSIHGLWPNNYRGKYPEFCCSRSSLDQREIRDLIQELEDKWGTLYRGKTDLSFWNHEWNKHGTCAGSVSEALRGPRGYFSTTLQLFDKLNLVEALSRSSIVPQSRNSNRPYDLVDIKNAIGTAIGANPTLDCKKLGNSRGENVLTGVNVCFDPQTLKPIDCKRQGKCRGREAHYYGVA